MMWNVHIFHLLGGVGYVGSCGYDMKSVVPEAGVKGRDKNLQPT